MEVFEGEAVPKPNTILLKFKRNFLQIFKGIETLKVLGQDHFGEAYAGQGFALFSFFGAIGVFGFLPLTPRRRSTTPTPLLISAILLRSRAILTTAAADLDLFFEGAGHGEGGEGEEVGAGGVGQVVEGVW